MKLMLPVPPSVNELYSPRKGGGLRKSDKYKSWLMQAGQFYLVEKRKLTPITGQYTFVIRLPATMRGDADNRIKAPLDFVKNVGLVPDDNIKLCLKASAEADPALTIYAEIEVQAA